MFLSKLVDFPWYFNRFFGWHQSLLIIIIRYCYHNQLSLLLLVYLKWLGLFLWSFKIILILNLLFCWGWRFCLESCISLHNFTSTGKLMFSPMQFLVFIRTIESCTAGWTTSRRFFSTNLTLKFYLFERNCLKFVIFDRVFWINLFLGH